MSGTNAKRKTPSNAQDVLVSCGTQTELESSLQSDKLKKCNRCNETKSVSEFYKRKDSKYGARADCKDYFNLSRKEYYDKNKKQINQRNKKYRDANKLSIAERDRKYNENNREVIAQKSKEYRLKNKLHLANRAKEYYKKNTESVKQRVKKWGEENPELVSEYKKKYKESPYYKFTSNLRRRVYMAIKAQGTKKSGPTFELLGCTPKEARDHIESLFTEGMSWDKFGLYGIHIDHIRPCASFNLEDPEEQRKCFHFSNLQPLWSHDNLSKGSKLDWKPKH